MMMVISEMGRTILTDPADCRVSGRDITDHGIQVSVIDSLSYGHWTPNVQRPIPSSANDTSVHAMLKFRCHIWICFYHCDSDRTADTLSLIHI